MTLLLRRIRKEKMCPVFEVPKNCSVSIAMQCAHLRLRDIRPKLPEPIDVFVSSSHDAPGGAARLRARSEEKTQREEDGVPLASEQRYEVWKGVAMNC
jgi:hypothetical protein